MDINNSNIPAKEYEGHSTKYGLLSLRTRIGGRKENQDSLGYFETAHGLLIVVCDGMGGAQGGSTASKMAVTTIFEQVAKTEQTEPEQILIEAINQANQVIYHTGKNNPELQGMGTTVVALLINDDKATVAHVGDSRVYQLRGSKKVFRTFDHSMVFELVKRGTLTEEQARLSAESNVILRALGTKPDVEIEINSNIPFLAGDRFLLCSDGVSGAVPEKELLKLIRADKSVEVTAENIAHRVDLVGISNGGKHDNLTAALIELNINSIIRPKMDKTTKALFGIIISLLIISVIINICQGFPKKGENNLKVNDTTQVAGINNLKSQIYEFEKKDSLNGIRLDSLIDVNNRLSGELKSVMNKREDDSVKLSMSTKLIKSINDILNDTKNNKKIESINKIIK